MRNQYGGHCLVCKKYVPPKHGWPQRLKGKWAVRCLDCKGKKLDESNTEVRNSI